MSRGDCLRNRPMFYVLDGHTPVAVELEQLVDQFADRFEGTRRVALDEVAGVTVSTVFLGIDLNWSPHGPPVLFETMIFGGPDDDYQERYSTWEEAEEGHRRALALVQPWRRPWRYLLRLRRTGSTDGGMKQ